MKRSMFYLRDIVSGYSKLTGGSYFMVRRNVMIEDMFGRRSYYDIDVVTFREDGMSFLARCWEGYKEFKYSEKKCCFIAVNQFEEIPKEWQTKLGDPRQLEFDWR